MLYHNFFLLCTNRGFPDSSVGKESACNAGDPGSIPGSGRSPGKGKGYLLQYSWASLVAQLVKNLPTIQETWVRSLGWEDPPERERLPTPVFWPGEFHGLYIHGVAKSWTRLSDFHFHIDNHPSSYPQNNLYWQPPKVHSNIKVHSCFYTFCGFGQIMTLIYHCGISQNIPTVLKSPLCSHTHFPDIFTVSTVLPSPEYHTRGVI